MKHGVCKLCLKEADLLDSHYLPKRAYSMNMAKTLKNPNPVRLAHGQAKQISDQLRGTHFVLIAKIDSAKMANSGCWLMCRRIIKNPFRFRMF
jgi:hypothetical protein